MMIDFMGKNIEVPQIRLRELRELVKYDRNSRTHSPAQVAQLERLLKTYGWTNPVLIDDMGIVAGHGRCLAAEALYKRGEQIRFPGGAAIPIGMIPTLDCSGWSASERRAYIIADNRSALSAGWDEDMLALELKELEKDGFDLELTAFDDSEIAALLEMSEEPTGDEDAMPQPEPETVISKPGDIWILGNHRLAVGDCTDARLVDLLMQGKQADICLTDPPYNVDLSRKNRLLDKLDGLGRDDKSKIANDKLNKADFAELITSALEVVFQNLSAGATLYMFHSDAEGLVFRQAVASAGFKFSQSLIWLKNNIVLGPARYQPIHEPIIVARKPGKSQWHGGRKQKTVMELDCGHPFQQLDDGRWCVRHGDDVLIIEGSAKIETAPTSVLYHPKPATSGLHQSQKPVELLVRLLKNSAKPGQLVFDPFVGSGSTLIAAEQLAMRAMVIELEPETADMIIRRWQAYTGEAAVNAQTSVLFDGSVETRDDDSDF